MLLVTEYDNGLELEGKIPPSLIRKVYLTEGAVPTLNNTPTMFGKPVHFVYLGYNLRSVEEFVKSLSGDTSRIFLIAPLSRWSLYSLKLKFVDDLKISNQFDTRKSKVDLLSRLSGLNAARSAKAMKIMKYNFAQLESNLDLLKWCARTGADVESALFSIENLSYTDVLFYLCDNTKGDRGRFIRALYKYRNARKYLIKYLKDILDDYIEYRLNNVNPPKSSEYTVKKLGFFLYLEDAMELRYALDSVKSIPDLLRGELA